MVGDPGAGKILALVGSWRRRHDGTRATGAGLAQTGGRLPEPAHPGYPQYNASRATWYPRQDSNLRFRLRRPALYPTELRGPDIILVAANPLIKTRDGHRG